MGSSHSIGAWDASTQNRIRFSVQNRKKIRDHKGFWVSSNTSIKVLGRPVFDNTAGEWVCLARIGQSYAFVEYSVAMDRVWVVSRRLKKEVAKFLEHRLERIQSYESKTHNNVINLSLDELA